MSMRPVGLPEIPEQTVVVARAAFPKGSLAIRVRDHLAEVFVDEPFAEAFGVRGAPGLSPGVLSLVTVLQFAEDLTDRQAAAMAVRAIDWKFALGAELTDTGFDASVLSKFRARLSDNGMERVVFDRLLEHCKDAGLVAAGGKQRTDSTHVISAVRDLNRLELAGESVRAALEALAVAAPLWLAGQIDVTEFAERYGPRVDGWRMPPSQTKRDRLAQVFGQDALALCRAAWADDAPVWIRQIEAVHLLRQVLVQTYIIRSDSRGRQVIKKRDADDGVPPGQLRLASPYDADARWAARGDDLFWCGYRIHLTETCTTLTDTDADAGTGVMPNLITDVHTTDATVPDVKAGANAGVVQPVGLPIWLRSSAERSCERACAAADAEELSRAFPIRSVSASVTVFSAASTSCEPLSVRASSEDRRSDGFGCRAAHPCFSRRSTLLLVAPMPMANSAARSATRDPGWSRR
jgi:transposase